MKTARIAAIIVAVLGALMGVTLSYAAASESRALPASRGVILASKDTSAPAGTIMPGVLVSETANISGTLRVAQAIVDFYNTYQFSSTVPFSITADAVVDLKASGMGFGEIMKAIFFAQVSGNTVDGIVEMRNDGLGWGEIKKSVDDVYTGKQPNLGSAMRNSGKVKKAESVEEEEEEEESTSASASPDATGHGKTTAPGQNKTGGAGDDGGKDKGGDKSRGNSDNAPGKKK